MARIVRESDRTPVSELAKKHAVSDETIYSWRRKFGTMTADEAKRACVSRISKTTLYNRVVLHKMSMGDALALGSGGSGRRLPQSARRPFETRRCRTGAADIGWKSAWTFAKDPKSPNPTNSV